ncbi:MAG: hypothetical protein WAM14_16305 [Candidatus Nitrosopolaris sp.]
MEEEAFRSPGRNKRQVAIYKQTILTQLLALSWHKKTTKMEEDSYEEGLMQIN